MNPDATLNAARSAFRAGQFTEAARLARDALRRRPRDADAASLAGLALLRLPDLDGALRHLQDAARLRPSEPTFHVNLGIALLRRGSSADAIAAFDRAIALKPDLAPAHFNRANALRGAGDLGAAESGYRRALDLRPGHAGTLCNLANTLTDLARVDEALPLYHRALESEPGNLAARNSLGTALLQIGHIDEAVAAFEAVLSSSPTNLEACTNLGNALKSAGRLEEAASAYDRALRLAPESEVAANGLGNALLGQGRIDEAVAAYRRALAIRPDYDTARSNLILALNYAADLAPAQVVKPARVWGARLGAATSPIVAHHANPPDPERRLRIGFVSPDFRTHSCAYFLDPLFQAHDRDACEFFAYAEVPAPDAFTERLQRACGHWRSTVGRSDADVARQVIDDGIDILVDAAGHTAGNRLSLFARRPAPVQVTWLGYPNTTGLDAIGTRLVDTATDPEGDTELDACYAERRLRLPHCFICYAPPDVGAEIGPLPARQSGTITFGSFNNLPKMTARVIEVWAGVLRAVPGSRLLLKNRSLTDEATRDRFRAMFEAQGVEGERIDNAGWTRGTREHLETYNRVDIALDTFPYNGTTTTCEAL
ncbi:MAG: tetratricopeptide repeat protein, partial [Phycisphaerales bacterium]|nr:tetratricopeptide repeat protein [Phycisphaerales bacterium]